jgi:hypothetical protein
MSSRSSKWSFSFTRSSKQLQLKSLWTEFTNAAGLTSVDKETTDAVLAKGGSGGGSSSSGSNSNNSNATKPLVAFLDAALSALEQNKQQALDELAEDAVQVSKLE